jgi:protein O-mannosyl-transferase
MAERNANRTKTRPAAQPPLGRSAARPPGSPNPRRGGRPIGISIGLAVLVGWTFLPSVGSEFSGYDDDLFVTANAQVQGGLTWHNMVWAFRHPVAANWHPLTTLSHMLDCQVYGLKPWGHHLTSVLLHMATSVLVWLVFRRMTGACWRSAVLAALFALHPLRVESVTWVAERKDVLSAFFWMLTLWAYGKYVEESKQSKVLSLKSEVEPGATVNASRFTFHASRFYALSLLFFALGLMSKPMLVTLPFVLLLLDYWPLGRMEKAEVRGQKSEGGGDGSTEHVSRFTFHVSRLTSLLLEKVSFFALAAAAAAIAFAVQAGEGNVRTTGEFLLGARAQNALVSYCRYVGKFFWPVELCIFYPFPAGWPLTTVLLSGLALLGISVVALVLGRRHQYLPTGWFWFVGTLVPVIGFVQIGLQAMADHYTYIPTIGLLLALVWGAHELTGRWRYRTAALPVIGAVAVILCTALTRHQIGFWKDEETIWVHALAVTENNAIAHHNLAVTLTARGAFDEAFRHHEEALRIGPERDFFHTHLADALVRRHRIAEGIDHYRAALRLNPREAQVYNNLAWILAANADPQVRNGPEAMTLAERACQLTNSKEAVMVGTLAAAYAEAGRFAEAVTTAEKATLLAEQANQPELAARNRQLLELYRAGKPYHEPAGP